MYIHLNDLFMLISIECLANTINIRSHNIIIISVCIKRWDDTWFALQSLHAHVHMNIFDCKFFFEVWCRHWKRVEFLVYDLFSKVHLREKNLKIFFIEWNTRGWKLFNALKHRRKMKSWKMRIEERYRKWIMEWMNNMN